MFTLMRFTEWVNPKTDNLEWLIRKDGCMHCAEPGCLEGLPGARRDRASIRTASSTSCTRTASAAAIA